MMANFTDAHIDGLVQDYSNSNALAMELLQSCTKPSIYASPGLNIVNTLRPRQNGRHFPNDILKYIFLNESIWILI